MLRYEVEPGIKELAIRSIVAAELHDVKIAPAHPGLEELKTNAARAISARPDGDLENAILESYRAMVRRVGRSASTFPPAAATLLKLVRRLGRFPTINCVVDAYNIVAGGTSLALGVHDIEKLAGTIRFRICTQEEQFVPIGSPDVKWTRPGDYVYSDDRQILAWLDSRDSDVVKLSLASKHIVIVIQGTDYTTREYNTAAAKEACELITRYCGGAYEIHPVD
jgi:DNA/RNA-binding domain of Phe-tRNA-synthetase-like protein